MVDLSHEGPYLMDGVEVTSATYFCRVCRGEPLAPWPPEPGKGPTHHTCHPGEELGTIKQGMYGGGKTRATKARLVVMAADPSSRGELYVTRSCASWPI